MPDKNLVLIHGLKYSGKGTIADVLIREYGYTKVKMADPLKNMLRSLLRDAGMREDIIERCIEGDLKEKPLKELCGRSARHAMMKLGDEWRNMISQDLWTNIAVMKVKSLLQDDKKVVIDDIRYPFEIEAFKTSQLTPSLFVVTRGTFHFRPVEEDRHPSEIPMDIHNFDHHFDNCGTITDLQEKIRKIMS